MFRVKFYILIVLVSSVCLICFFSKLFLAINTYKTFWLEPPVSLSSNASDPRTCLDVEHTWLCADSVLRDYWSNVGLWQVINIQNVLVCINMSVYTIHWPYLYQYQCYVCMDIEHKWLVRARIPHNADIISEIIPHNHCNYAPSTTINSVARQIQDIVHRGHWLRKISFEESFFLAVGWLYLSQTVNVLILNLSFLSAKQQYVTLCLATYLHTHTFICMHGSKSFYNLSKIRMDSKIYKR